MTSPSTDRRYGVSGNLAMKAPCRVATTTSITLSGEQTIDGVAVVTGDRVLVKDQSSSVANGIYVCDTGDWSRDIDANGNRDFVTGTTVLVISGTTNASTYWKITTTGSITIGTTSLVWGESLISDSALLSFTQAGTGAVARSVRTKLRESVSVTDFGADSTGATDCTTAITNAITAAKAGCGVVFFPKGKYLVSTGGISISGVTLIGAGTPEFGNTYDDDGSVIMLDSITTSPFTLGLGWNISGLTFYYPNQDGTAVTPVVYPPLFIGTYVAGGVMDNCTVVNAYQVFKFNVGTAIGDLRFSQCRMYGIDKVFWFLEGAPEVINISDCMFSRACFTKAGTPNHYLRDYTSASGEFCRIDVGSSGYSNHSVDGFNMSNTLVFGYRYGIRVMSGTLNVSSINNNWFDAVRTALSVEAPGVIANIRWTDNYHWSMRDGFSFGTATYNTTDSTMSFSPSGGGGNLLISGNDFVFSMGSHISWNALAFVDVKITDNRFRNWGNDEVSAATSYYGVLATDSALNGSIALNKFQPSSGAVSHYRNGVGLGGESDVAIVCNEFDDCYYGLYVPTSTKVKTIGNTSNNSTVFGFMNSSSAGVVQASANRWDSVSGPSGLPIFNINGGTQTFTGTKTQVIFNNAVQIDDDSNFNNTVVAAGAFVTGEAYRIKTVGTTDFTLIGAASNTVGLAFIATGAGTGTGDAYKNSVFIAPSAGKYEISVLLNNTTGVTANDVWILSLEQAGSATVIFSSSVLVPSNTALAAPLKASGIYNMAAGDTVRVYVTRSAGAGNYVSINNANYNSLCGKRVS